MSTRYEVKVLDLQTDREDWAVTGFRGPVDAQDWIDEQSRAGRYDLIRVERAGLDGEGRYLVSQQIKQD